jgi:hypothetical protein
LRTESTLPQTDDRAAQIMEAAFKAAQEAAN